MRPSNPNHTKVVICAILLLTGVLSFLLYFSYTSHRGFLSTLGISYGPLEPITYLPYTFGYAALLQTLHAYDYAGWRNIVVVDNSWDHHAFEKRSPMLEDFKSLSGVVKTPVHLRFAQLQGFIDGMAREQGEEVYLWGHTDTILLRNQSHPYDSMLKGLGLVRASDRLGLHKRVGVIFYQYDLLSAVFAGPSAHAPWDPAMPQYGSDCDRYHRLRRAGYAIIQDPIGVGHIVHTHAVLTHEQKMVLWESGLTLDEQVQMLEEWNSATAQYAWREGFGATEDDGEEMEEEQDLHDGLQVYDREAAAVEGNAGRTYFESKWGPFDCELEGRVPNFDIPPVVV